MWRRNKEITMTINEFLEYTETNQLERMCRKILNNNNMRKIVVLLLAIGFILIDQPVFATPNLSGVDKLGSIFLSILQRGGYWICLIMGIKDIICALVKGGDNFKEIGKVIMTYVVAFASLYMLPYLFDLAKSCFAQ